MRADNTHHLLEAARRRREQTLARAQRALQDISDSGRPITVTGLAALAGVSRAWFYAQPELRDEIKRLRGSDRSHQPPPADGQRSSDASLLQRLKLAHERIRELTDDNHHLRDQVARMHGELCAARLGITHVADTVHDTNNLVSLPKTATRPKITLARFNSRFSARNFRSSSAVSVDTPDRLPASTSARRTQFCTVCAVPIPNFCATDSTAAHSDPWSDRISATIRTARSFNSDGYRFDVLAMTPSFLIRKSW